MSISSKIGSAPQALNKWGKKVEFDTSQLNGVMTEHAAKMKALEWDLRELKQANEIIREAFAYIAQAGLGHPFKR